MTNNIIYKSNYEVLKHYKNFRNMWRGIMIVNIYVFVSVIYTIVK